MMIELMEIMIFARILIISIVIILQVFIRIRGCIEKMLKVYMTGLHHLM